jgi:uncharacterized protein YdeI (YjbR/CyaY-like superfamily)
MKQGGKKPAMKAADDDGDDEAPAAIKRGAAKRSVKKKAEMEDDTPHLKRRPAGDFAAAIAANDEATTQWHKLSPSCRNEYMDWVEEAVKPDTRAKRIDEAVLLIAKGKTR